MIFARIDLTEMPPGCVFEPDFRGWIFPNQTQVMFPETLSVLNLAWFELRDFVARREWDWDEILGSIGIKAFGLRAVDFEEGGTGSYRYQERERAGYRLGNGTGSSGYSDQPSNER